MKKDVAKANVAVDLRRELADALQDISSLQGVRDGLRDQITALQQKMAESEQKRVAAECRLDAALYAMVIFRNEIAKLQTSQRRFEFDEKKREWVALAV